MSAVEWLFNIIGVIGAFMLLFGFFRVNNGKWSNKSLVYEFDNLIGAALIIVYQMYYHAYVTVVVNAIWAIVALWGIIVFFRRFQKHKARKKNRKSSSKSKV